MCLYNDLADREGKSPHFLVAARMGSLDLEGMATDDSQSEGPDSIRTDPCVETNTGSDLLRPS